jgi:hypothetical protein
MDRRKLGFVITIVGTLVLANAWWFMRGPEQTSARERAHDQASERERSLPCSYKPTNVPHRPRWRSS